jgi:FkbM family methyltransferase
VDVGAHHPRRFSNTQRFYERGWNGINIEPNPDALVMFMRQRKRDINVGCGVAEANSQLTYYMFNEPALNSFDTSVAGRRAEDRYTVIGTRDVPVKRLDSILEESLPEGMQIDFMSIDVEGYDYQVLQSNDWSRFRPSCLLVEAFDFDLERPAGSPIHIFLDSNGYRLFAKTFNTLFYIDRSANLPNIKN